MNRNRIVQLVALGVFGAMLAASGLLSTRINRSIGQHDLAYVDRAEENAPPQVALGIALGAFRGLFVNFLWIRAHTLKEAGKYHEAMTLARAITALQPRFPEVWTFHAWNMAYNISVSATSPRERWRWVNKGVRLLRDEGVVYNPNALLLHKELSWIFLHKIAGYTDDANQYYKRALAAEWTEVLGEPPAAGSFRSTQEATDAYVRWLEPIAAAPLRVDELAAADPRVRELVSRLRSRVGSNLDRAFLERYTQMSYLLNSSYAGLGEDVLRMGPKNRALRELIEDPRYAEAWPRLLAHVRRVVIENEYNMDPERMIRYTRKYGPLDWRHPAAHAVYWAAKGVEAALSRIRTDTATDYDFVNADRQVIQSIQELYRSGEVYFSYLYFIMPQLQVGSDDPVYSLYLAIPNPHFVDTYGDILEELRARSMYDQETRTYTLYDAGYENFLKDAIRFFYRRGEIARAQDYHDRLITRETMNINDTYKILQNASDLETFINQQYENERYTSPYVAASEISAALQSAFASGLLAGEDDLFRRNWEFAETFHRRYTEKQVLATQAAGAYERQSVVDPDFRFYAGMHFATFISTLNIEQAEAVYDRSPPDLRRFGYLVMQDVLKGAPNSSIALAGREVDEVFPPPDGIERFRTWWTEQLRRRAGGRPTPRDF